MWTHEKDLKDNTDVDFVVQNPSCGAYTSVVPAFCLAPSGPAQASQVAGSAEGRRWPLGLGGAAESHAVLAAVVAWAGSGAAGFGATAREERGFKGVSWVFCWGGLRENVEIGSLLLAVVV